MFNCNFKSTRGKCNSPDHFDKDCTSEFKKCVNCDQNHSSCEKKSSKSGKNEEYSCRSYRQVVSNNSLVENFNNKFYEFSKKIDEKLANFEKKLSNQEEKIIIALNSKVNEINRNKFTEFSIFLSKFNSDLVSINETKCNDVTAFQNFNFQEYNIVHKERKSSRNASSGVAILIKKKFSFELISDYDYLDLELVCIKIKFLKEDVNIIIYYNPTDPKKLLNFNIFKKLNDEKNFIICGDFNAKSLSFGSFKENKNREILDLILQLNNVIFLNNEDSTHKSFSSDDESILDYILCSSSIYNNFKHFKVLKVDSMSSDHYPLLVNCDFYKILNEEKNCFDPEINLNFKKADWKKYSNSLPKTVP
ncbi:unnamed protein product, partial [Brachionus calyciflorus]